MLPHPEENLLRHIFGFGAISEHPARQTDHARQVATNQLSGGTLVAVANSANEFLVWIPHGAQANSERL